ncbi:Uma2 family endonuclease [Hydrogenimonas sp.]
MGAPQIEPRYTWQDYLTWEDRWELIDGVAYAMAPAPYPKHQRVVLRVSHTLYETLECPDCEVWVSPVDWKIDDENVVQPDVAVFCDEDADAPYFTKTPPLVVEVLYKSTAHKDVTVKFELYERVGVRWYVIIDPETERAEIFENRGGTYELFRRIDETKERVTMQWGACRTAIDFAKIFA